jgi:hypothetical protein
MERTEIRKALYKQNPTARLMFIRMGSAYYEASLEDETFIEFQIPVTDMGEVDFFPRMEAKYLGRWVTQAI